MADAAVKITVTAETKQAAAGLDDVKQKLESVGAAAKGAAASAQNMGESLRNAAGGSGFKKFGKQLGDVLGVNMEGGMVKNLLRAEALRSAIPMLAANFKPLAESVGLSMSDETEKRLSDTAQWTRVGGTIGNLVSAKMGIAVQAGIAGWNIGGWLYDKIEGAFDDAKSKELRAQQAENEKIKAAERARIAAEKQALADRAADEAALVERNGREDAQITEASAARAASDAAAAQEAQARAEWENRQSARIGKYDAMYGGGYGIQYGPVEQEEEEPAPAAAAPGASPSARLPAAREELAQAEARLAALAPREITRGEAAQSVRAETEARKAARQGVGVFENALTNLSAEQIKRLGPGTQAALQAVVDKRQNQMQEKQKTAEEKNTEAVKTLTDEVRDLKNEIQKLDLNAVFQ